MRKHFIVTILSLSVPFFVNAAISHDLYVGLTHNDEVKELQQFLTDRKMYAGPVNGNFFALTQGAVKRFQESEGISGTGYVGTKTREKINAVVPQKIEMDRKAMILFLTSQIRELMLKLAELKQQQAEQVVPASPAPVPAPVSTSTPLVIIPQATSSVPTSTPEVMQTGVLFGGASTTTFPDTVTNPMKIGDITVRNNTSDPLLFSQLVLDIQDSMNSPLNRRGTTSPINIILRNGSTTADTVLEKKSFTFSVYDPMLQESHMHRYQVNLSYPITFGAGETKSASLWVENFDYVISGALKFALYDIQTTRSVTTVGGFSFVLNR